MSFLASSPHALPVHHPAWAQLLADAYGFRGFALAILEEDQVVAGMPMLEVGLPGRRRWVSLPFTDRCPPLGPRHLERRIADGLRQIHDLEGLRQIEVRGAFDGTDAGARVQAVAVGHELALEPDPDAVFRRLHKSQTQRAITRARREGVTVRRADRQTDLTQTFYRLHLLTRRRIGVPVQPRRFFQLLWERIVEPGIGELLLAEIEGLPVAGAVFVQGPQHTLYKYGASDARAWSRRPNHALFWQAIVESCEAGKKVFDFGRSGFEDRGLREFKNAWGTEEFPLVYTTIGGGPAKPSLGSLSRTGASVIRRSPLWVCQLLGQALYRYAA